MHGRLLQSVQWFSSYLSDRKRFVLFKCKQSEQSKKQRDFPKIYYGALFFIVFMNDMPMSTRKISNVNMYAGDSIISACVKNVQEIDQKLSNVLQKISNWCDETIMVINIYKDRDLDDPANVYNITALLTDCPENIECKHMIYTYKSRETINNKEERSELRFFK